MESGALVSDDIMIGIVRDRFDRPDVARGFILDGFPRTVAQATALEAIMTERSPLIVIDIRVPETELVRRLTNRLICVRCGSNAPEGITVDAEDTDDARCRRCGGEFVQRADDNDDVVRERLQRLSARRRCRWLSSTVRARPSVRSTGRSRPLVSPNRLRQRLTRSRVKWAWQGGRGGDCLPLGAELREDAGRRPSGRRGADAADVGGRPGRDDGGSRRARGADDSGGGRDAGVQGISRVSGDDLRIGQRRGHPRHPVRTTGAGSRAMSSPSMSARC